MSGKVLSNIKLKERIMTDTFVPNKPEESIVVKITKREAVLIDKLRKYNFGKFVVHKVNNTLVRIEINDSQMIEEETDIDLD